MNPEQEKAEQIRKLLAIKRHELPPPGYFQSFPGKVLARLEAPSKPGILQWIMGVWDGLLNRPVFSGAVGTLTAITLLAGLFHSQGDQLGTSTPFPVFPSSDAGSSPGEIIGTIANYSQVADAPSEYPLGTNPTTRVQSQSSLFDTTPSLQIQKAGYRRGSY